MSRRAAPKANAAARCAKAYSNLPPGRSQGECRSALREGLVDLPPGRSQGECRSALREG